MNSVKLRKLVTAALMAALTCVTTFILQIPSPAGGYIHPGDAFVLLSGVILGPIYGFLSAGIGSMTADLLSGWPQYAPATFLIKALFALAAAFLYKKGKISSIILAGIVGGLVVTTGYFITDYILWGIAGAMKQVPLNLVQNSFGIVLSALLYPLLYKVPQIKDMMERRK